MLTDAELTLISAAVDGELSPADARRYQALVAANPFAAAVADQFRVTAERLGRMRKRLAPALLLPKVMARLPVVVAVTPARGRARRPVWQPFAIAASLLFCVSVGSFWFFSARHDRDATVRARPVSPVASNPPSPLPLQVPSVPAPDKTVAVGPDVLPLPREVAVAVGPMPRDTAPMPRSHGGDLVGSGISEQAKPLQAVELKLPFAGAVSDFAKEDVRSRFAVNFAGEPAVRIDLFARNLPAAIDLVTATAKAAGVVVTADAATQDRIGKKVPAAYALFVEGLTPAELARLLEAVATQVAANPQPPISTVHAFAAGAVEQKEWRDLFGRDLGLFRSARVDPQSPARPISDGTLGKIKAAVGKNPEKAGVMLTYLPVGGRSAPMLSKEIKAFLDGRGERKAGTLPAFVVIRPAAN